MTSFDHFRFEKAQVQLTWIRFIVQGADALSFIQGQSTNDVNELLEDSFQLHSFIERTGKVETHFYLGKSAEGLELFVSPETSSVIKERFEKFVISEDVDILEKGIEEWWLCIGPKTPPGKYGGRIGGERAVLSKEKFESTRLLKREEFSQFLMWQGEPEPDIPYHRGELINQTRLFELAVSLKKGCYTGQETVSKIHHNRGAAWAPVLLKSSGRIEEVTKTIVVSERKIAQIGTIEVTQDGTWATADVLRDFRVKGMTIPNGPGVLFEVLDYPRFSNDSTSKARELFYRGTDHFQAEENEEALRLWEKSIEIDPSFADAYEAIGVLLGRENKLEVAIEWMKKLLEVDPSSVMAHTNLSLFLMKQGKIQEAEEHKSLATVATFASFGRESQRKEAEEAQRKKLEQEQLQREQMFKQVLEIDPEDTLANYGLGTLCLERGEFADAKKLFETVINSDSQYSVAYLGLGKALIKLNEPHRAKEILTHGVSVAAKKGEMMPANEMQGLIGQLS